jgi:hypothetical protein
MAFYRAFEVKVPAGIRHDFCILFPMSDVGGGGHEFLTFYGPFRLASEVTLPSAAPASEGAPAVNSNQIAVMR